MSDNLSSDLRGWAKSGLTRNLYSGATPLCDTLAQAADSIDALKAELAKARDAALEEARKAGYIKGHNDGWKAARSKT